MNDQQLIDYHFQRESARRARNGEKPPDGEGIALGAIPGLVWADPNRSLHGWQPPEPAPTPIDPRELARREHAEQLKAEAVAQINPALIAAARQALDASAAANAQLRTLEQEKRDLVEPLTEQQVLRSLVIDRRIEAARDLASQANSAVDPALAAMRAPMLDYYSRTIYQREYQAARDLDAEAERLEVAASDIRLSVVNARGALENYLPPTEAPVVAPVKRRLFERKRPQ